MFACNDPLVVGETSGVECLSRSWNIPPLRPVDTPLLGQITEVTKQRRGKSLGEAGSRGVRGSGARGGGETLVGGRERARQKIRGTSEGAGRRSRTRAIEGRTARCPILVRALQRLPRLLPPLPRLLDSALASSSCVSHSLPAGPLSSTLAPPRSGRHLAAAKQKARQSRTADTAKPG